MPTGWGRSYPPRTGSVGSAVRGRLLVRRALDMPRHEGLAADGTSRTGGAPAPPVRRSSWVSVTTTTPAGSQGAAAQLPAFDPFKTVFDGGTELFSGVCNLFQGQGIFYVAFREPCFIAGHAVTICRPSGAAAAPTAAASTRRTAPAG